MSFLCRGFFSGGGSGGRNCFFARPLFMSKKLPGFIQGAFGLDVKKKHANIIAMRGTIK